MRHFFIGLLFPLTILSFYAPASAQNKTGLIEKNINLEAQELYHDLNTTKDTLILKSKNKIHYIYSLNNKNEREVDTHVKSDSFKLALQDLSAGKHLFAVSYQQKKILFVLRVHDPNMAYLNKPKGPEVVSRNH